MNLTLTIACVQAKTSKTDIMLINLECKERLPSDGELDADNSRAGKRRRRAARLARLRKEPAAKGSIKYIESNMPTSKTVDRDKMLAHVAYYTQHLPAVRNQPLEHAPTHFTC